MPGTCSSILSAISRKKPLDEKDLGETKLDRVLSVYDLTALGVGATLGAGVYILSGEVGRYNAGPGTVVAFFIAALTSVLAGLCYAEFGARVPKAGSGYVYSYVTVGELTAFVIGWNLILSYVIGAASVAKAWTANFDALLDGSIKGAMTKCCKLGDSSFIAPYPDLFSFALIMILTCLIAFGVKEFALVNKVFTFLNVCVIVFVIVVGFTQANLKNWQLTRTAIENEILSSSNGTCELKPLTSISVNDTAITNDNLTDCLVEPGLSEEDTKGKEQWPGYGGFLPYGVSGLMSGAATCFYAFVGFDIIATTGEEAINPQRNIPLGIVYSLMVCCIAYLGISASLTLMQPYYLLDKDTPLPVAFAYVGLKWAEIPVTVGAICALTTSLLGAMFPMPRIIYAMATDGLLFKFLAKVSEKSKTPVIATFISGGIAAIMACLFETKPLVDLMSIGTLAAYTLVAASVLLLRYSPDAQSDYETTKEQTMTDSSTNMLSKLVRPKISVPTKQTCNIVYNCTIIIMVSSIIAGVALNIKWEDLVETNLPAVYIPIIMALILVAATIIISCQPQSKKELSFSVPWVPFVPVMNMVINLGLMMQLSAKVWAMLAVWMALGFSIYFFYGVWHSEEAKQKDQELLSMNKSENEKLNVDV